MLNPSLLLSSVSEISSPLLPYFMIVDTNYEEKAIMKIYLKIHVKTSTLRISNFRSVLFSHFCKGFNFESLLSDIIKREILEY